MDQEFLSIKEVAVIFAVNEATIRRAIKRGWIIAIRIGEGRKSPFRISRQSIDKIHFFMNNKSKPLSDMDNQQS